MRRPFGVIIIGALATALLPHIAWAQYTLPQPSPHALQIALMQRIFGESSDHRAAQAAALGDHASESPLRAYALRVTLPQGAVSVAVLQPGNDNFTSGVASVPFVAVGGGDALIPAPVSTATSSRLSTTSLFRPVTADYQPTATLPSVSADTPVFEVPAGAPSASATTSLIHFSPVLTPIGGFAAGITTLNSGTGDAITPTTVNLPLAVRLGKLHVQTRFEGAQVEAPRLALQDQASGVGANFNVRAGARRVNVDLSSSFERLTRSDAPTLAGANVDGGATLELPSDGAPILVPAFANVNKYTLSTGFAVPVTQSLTFGVKFDAQHLLGGYGAPGLANLDAQANTYGARLTYTIPHTASALTLSAKHVDYQDNLLPINTYSQTGANVNFTVKF